MSKSFEEKLNERLGEYSTPPPIEAKAAVLNAVAAPDNLVPFYHYVGGLLLLLSLFMIGQRPLQQLEPQSSNVPPEIMAGSIAEIIEHSGELPLDDQEVGEEYQPDEPNENAPPTALLPPEEVLAVVQGYDESTRLVTHSVHKLGYDVGNESHNTGLIPLTIAKDEKRVFPPKESVFNVFFETGAFFLYNRLQPNLDDDIYIGDYDSPYSLSASRIGLACHLGMEKKWTERHTTRLGLVFNNYSQNFSFAVRGTSPDSVAIEEGFVQPYFDEEHVRISKRVSTLGVKFQSIWAFPSTYNSLYLAFEYQRLVGKGPLFTYDGTDYALVSPSQYLAEVGMRKKVLETRKGTFSLVPSLRYSVVRLQSDDILSVKPFSAGLSLSYSLK